MCLTHSPTHARILQNMWPPIPTLRNVCEIHIIKSIYGQRRRSLLYTRIWAIPQKLVILEETGNFSKHYASKLINLFLKCSIQKIKGGPIRIFSVPPLFFEISKVLGRKNALFLENNEKNFFSKCYRKKHYAYQVFGTKEWQGVDVK